jgi:hypothetical protein
MRPLVFILLSFALHAHAGALGDVAKVVVKSEIERRAHKQQTQTLIFDLPEQHAQHYNLHWRLSGRVGPFTVADQLGDGLEPKFGFAPQGGIHSFRQENMTRVFFVIRKDF